MPQSLDDLMNGYEAELLEKAQAEIAAEKAAWDALREEEKAAVQQAREERWAKISDAIEEDEEDDYEDEEDDYEDDF